MTQAEVNSHLAAVIGQAVQAGIPVSPHIDPMVRVNRRARTRFGCCRIQAGACLIEVAASLLDGGPEPLRQVLAHEILHTCPGCRNHGPQWKHRAARMSTLYGYRIRRTDSPADLGLTDSRPVRWLVVCSACGHSIPRMKRSPLVAHPERYRCRCGGRLYVVPGAPSKG